MAKVKLSDVTGVQRVLEIRMNADAACASNLHRATEELRTTATKMLEMGYYTMSDYVRFCKANDLELVF